MFSLLFIKNSFLGCYLMPNRSVTKRTMSLLHPIPKQIITRDTSSTKNGKEKLLQLTGAQIVSLRKANARSRSKLIFLEKLYMKVELMTWSARSRQKTVNKPFKILQMHTTIILNL